MPSQKFMLVLFLLVVLPLVIIFANHDVFFTFVSIIIVADSFKFIAFIFLGNANDPEENKASDKNNMSEKRDLSDNDSLDFKRFDIGIHITRNLIVILFYIYCSLYINLFILKILTALIILYLIYGINVIIASRSLISFKKNVKLDTAAKFAVRIISIFIIAAVAYNKFVKNVL
ncbi:hypothetical protein DFR58_11281 [Anaerobacterium chartisolvens]|uniref:Uncharacterized protein n=1 Tax=Anaerobacterium chartisolvens TaxID=1297424 RepID=A0A369B3I7_9FIRM|nr:hypothetical protein [Anaerobacterium chartisolvens]RCX16099.1 hypothetical protein DFR58_11281 [Anaerobacterium chartisolvens]